MTFDDGVATHTREDAQEKEANHFAMCLLMPEKFLRTSMAQLGTIDLTDDEWLKDLAKQYGVSIGIMTMRLKQLGYFDKL